MHVLHWPFTIPLDTPCVVAFGKFDGVHQGHQKLIHRALADARALGIAAGVVLFAQNPLTVLKPHQPPPPRLTTLAERLRLLSGLGLDFAAVLPCERQLLSLTAIDFAAEVLRRQLRVRRLVVGDGFRFGRGGKQGVAVLRDHPELGIDGVEVPCTRYRESPVSSTLIRQQVLEGNVAMAATLLGRPFAVTGTTEVEGDGVALTLPVGHAVPAAGRYLTRLGSSDSESTGATGLVRVSADPGMALHWAGHSGSPVGSGDRARLDFLDRLSP